MTLGERVDKALKTITDEIEGNKRYVCMNPAEAADQNEVIGHLEHSRREFRSKVEQLITEYQI